MVCASLPCIASPAPPPWLLQAPGRHVRALPFVHAQLLVVVLLEEGAPPTPALLAPLTEALCRTAGRAAAELEAEYGGATSLWHVHGYRYCQEDELVGAVR